MDLTKFSVLRKISLKRVNLYYNLYIYIHDVDNETLWYKLVFDTGNNSNVVILYVSESIQKVYAEYSTILIKKLQEGYDKVEPPKPAVKKFNIVNL